MGRSGSHAEDGDRVVGFQGRLDPLRELLDRRAVPGRAGVSGRTGEIGEDPAPARRGDVLKPVLVEGVAVPLQGFA